MKLKQRIEKLEEENVHLKVAVKQLSILNEIATAIRSTQSLDKIIDSIIHKCVEYLHVEQGVVLLPFGNACKTRSCVRGHVYNLLRE